mgnify:CR=1 FL=1
MVGQIVKDGLSGNIRIEDLHSFIDKKLEPSSWLEITQERVNQFAEATNDYQFIHVEPDKAEKTSFGGTIVHGLLLLSLLPYLNSEKAIIPANLMMSINYGSDKVRYLSPVRVGERVRSIQKITSVNEKKPGQWLINKTIEMEIEKKEKLALVANMKQLLIVNNHEST